MQAQHDTARVAGIEASWDRRLAGAMVERRLAAHEEAMAGVLLEGLRAAS